MSTGGRRTIAIDQTQARLDSTAVDAALAVLDRFMAALNAGDEPALLATLHFPHYRLAGGDNLAKIPCAVVPVRAGTGEKIAKVGARPIPHLDPAAG